MNSDNRGSSLDIDADGATPSVGQLCSYLHVGAFHARCFEALQAAGVSQHVVTPHRVQGTGVALEPGIPLHEGRQTGWALRHKLRYRLKVDAYTRHLERYPPLADVDLLHAHSLYADGFAARAFAETRRLPYMVTIRDGDISLFPRYYPHWARHARETLERASRVVFVNHRYRALLEGALGIELDDARCDVVPNGAEERWFDDSLREEGEHEGLSTRLVCTAKLMPRKNQLSLLEAVEIARRESGLDLTLDLIGKPLGRYGERVLARCEALPWARHLGTRTQAELVELYPRYGSLVLASHSENFGIVYAEALLAGLTVLYSKGHGFDGWGGGSTPYGVAVESRDVRSIANGIVTLASRRDRFAAGPELARTLFRWSSIAERLRGTYRAVASEPSTCS